MNAPQHPGSEVHENTRGAAPPAVEKADCKLGNVEIELDEIQRQGIPFGKSFGAAVGGGAEEPRGLLFQAFQTDFERQFEFVQRTWVDDPDFPKKRASQDPIITNNTTSGKIAGCPFHPRADASKCPIDFKHFVKTRGGAYFFVPSTSTLKEWLT